jgi:hypothetical protein
MLGIPLQTRSLRSSGFTRSRESSELLLMQKTELPRLATVCLRNTRHHTLITYLRKKYFSFPF